MSQRVQAGLSMPSAQALSWARAQESTDETISFHFMTGDEVVGNELDCAGKHRF